MLKERTEAVYEDLSGRAHLTVEQKTRLGAAHSHRAEKARVDIALPSPFADVIRPCTNKRRLFVHPRGQGPREATAMESGMTHRPLLSYL